MNSMACTNGVENGQRVAQYLVSSAIGVESLSSLGGRFKGFNVNDDNCLCSFKGCRGFLF